MLRNDFRQRDGQGIAIGDCRLLCGRHGKNQFNQVLIREDGRILKHRNGDGLDIARQLQRDIARQDG